MTFRIFISGLAVLAVISISSCETNKTKAESPSNSESLESATLGSSDEAETPAMAETEAPAPPSSPAAGGFLATDYAPLDKWLSERFVVKYKHQTPQTIFDEVPINQINFEKRNLPKGAPTLDLDSGNMSRRQILEHIANHWNLAMEVQNGDDGNPSYVLVTGP